MKVECKISDGPLLRQTLIHCLSSAGIWALLLPFSFSISLSKWSLHLTWSPKGLFLHRTNTIATEVREKTYQHQLEKTEIWLWCLFFCEAVDSLLCLPFLLWTNRPARYWFHSIVTYHQTPAKLRWMTWRTVPKLYTENARHKAYAFPGLTNPYMEANSHLINASLLTF